MENADSLFWIASVYGTKMVWYEEVMNYKRKGPSQNIWSKEVRRCQICTRFGTTTMTSKHRARETILLFIEKEQSTTIAVVRWAGVALYLLTRMLLRDLWQEACPQVLYGISLYDNNDDDDNSTYEWLWKALINKVNTTSKANADKNYMTWDFTHARKLIQSRWN